MNDTALKPTVSQLLNDKVISLTLTREETESRIYAVYAGSNKGKELKQGRILLEGFGHYLYVQTDKGITSKRYEAATGRTYKFNLSLPPENRAFIRGQDPSTGEALEVGSRLLVNEGGKQKKYHIAEANPEGMYNRSDSVVITCPGTGIKPSISFSVNEIQGQHCYALEVRVHNMNLDVPIRQFSRLELTAGYRNGPVQETFKGEIFSSYIESPNPDGITVFRCITTGDTSTFFNNKAIAVYYKGGTVTIRSLIDAVGATLNLKVHNYLLPVYNNLSVGMEKLETRAANAMALIDWMRVIIIQAIRFQENQANRSVMSLDAEIENDPRPLVELTSDGMYIYCANRPNVDVQDGKETEDAGYKIVDMDAIKGATFNGVALTVQSVWNPSIRPGQVFRMQPNIINGANLPNVMGEAEYGNTKEQNYLYRALTVNISFGTNSDENNMTVLAVPLQYLEHITDTATTTMTFNDWYKDKELNAAHDYYVTMELGQTGEDEATEQNEAEKNATSMYAIDITKKINSPGGLVYTVDKNDTLSRIAETYYAVWPATAPNGMNYLAEPFDCNKQNLENPSHYIGPLESNMLWPIIAVATYQKYVEAQRKSISNNHWSYHSVMTPNTIYPGEQLYIPTINSIRDLKKGVALFEFAVKAYATIPGYQAWVDRWKLAIEYLNAYRGA